MAKRTIVSVSEDLPKARKRKSTAKKNSSSAVVGSIRRKRVSRNVVRSVEKKSVEVSESISGKVSSGSSKLFLSHMQQVVFFGCASIFLLVQFALGTFQVIEASGKVAGVVDAQTLLERQCRELAALIQSIPEIEEVSVPKMPGSERVADENRPFAVLYRVDANPRDVADFYAFHMQKLCYHQYGIDVGTTVYSHNGDAVKIDVVVDPERDTTLVSYEAYAGNVAGASSRR